MSGKATDSSSPAFREQRIGEYVLSEDPARLDAVAVHAYLTRSYWSPGIPLGVVERALAGSICIGAYRQTGEQVGLVRVISDYATYAYVCDVYVLETDRAKGLSKAMLAMAMSHPRLQGMRTWNLRTRDAHKLYEQFGFNVIENPEGYMVLRFPDVYKTGWESSHRPA